MKKILCIAAFAGMFTLGYCQDVKVNINNQEATTKEKCPYRINGICSSEDIGGVDVTFEFIDDCTWLVFTNYNSFPVTVLYEISSRHALSGCNCLGWDKGKDHCFYTPDGTTGSLVLGVEGSKKLKIDHQLDCHGDWINNSAGYNLAGIICRKLSN